ncbi:hypothetical protein GF361_05630 [Candidatus Woesearchaeota archaeon]|nr:hypothetical protein [Candidatus Woesearchaeota archaeon]
MVFHHSYPLDYSHIGDTLQEIEKAIETEKNQKIKNLLQTSKSDIVHLLAAIKGHEEKNIETFIDSSPELRGFIKKAIEKDKKVEYLLNKEGLAISKRYSKEDAENLAEYAENSPLYGEKEIAQIKDHMRSAEEYWNIMKKGSSCRMPRLAQRFNSK